MARISQVNAGLLCLVLLAGSTVADEVTPAPAPAADTADAADAPSMRRHLLDDIPEAGAYTRPLFSST
jgi:hypothetical protein